MDKTLISALTKMDDVDFFVLEHHVTVARMIRNAMSKNGIDEKRMADILAVPVKKMKSVVNGSYPFDFMLLARLQSHLQQLASAEAKFRVEAEGIGFADYKHQYPLYVTRIEKLLDILEKQSNPQQHG